MVCELKYGMIMAHLPLGGAPGPLNFDLQEVVEDVFIYDCHLFASSLKLWF